MQTRGTTILTIKFIPIMTTHYSLFVVRFVNNNAMLMQIITKIEEIPIVYMRFTYFHVRKIFVVAQPYL